MSKTKPERIDDALDIARDYGGIDGAHHKMWVIDQMVRALAGEDYEGLIRDWEDGKEGPKTYKWDTGTPP